MSKNKMKSEKYSEFYTAIKNVKSITPVCIFSAFQAAGFAKVDGGVQSEYDSISKKGGVEKSAYEISYRGKTINVYFFKDTCMITPNDISEKIDLGVAIRQDGTVNVFNYKQQVYQVVKKHMLEEISFTQLSKGVSSSYSPIVKVDTDAAFANDTAFFDSLMKGTGGSSQHKFRCPGTQEFLNIYASQKKIKTADMGTIFGTMFLPRDITRNMAEMASNMCKGQIVVPMSATGELLSALQEQKVNAVGYESHPDFLAISQNFVQGVTNEDPVNTMKKIIAGEAEPYQNVVATFPFVPYSIYSAGIGIIDSTESAAVTVLPPLEQKRGAKVPAQKDCAGMILLSMAVQSIAPGGVGIFTVPKHVKSSADAKYLRRKIVSHGDVVSYVSAGDIDIMCVVKRDKKIEWSADLIKANVRPSDLSSDHVRWISKDPFFVYDTSAAGKNSFTGGSAKTIAEYIEKIATPFIKQSDIDGLASAEGEKVPVYGTDTMIVKSERVVEHADIIVKRVKQGNLFQVSKGNGKPSAANMTDFVIECKPGKTDALLDQLTSQKTADFVSVASRVTFVSADLIMSVPL